MAHTRQENKSSGQTKGKILTSGMAGFAELLVFHPVDTVIKRLQANRTRVIQPNFFWNQNFLEYSRIATKGTYKVSSLYNGLGSGMVYKVGQRTYKYTVQDLLSARLKKMTTTDRQKVLAEAGSGAVVGAVEAVLLPLDTVKILFQTKAPIVKDKSIINVLMEQNTKLYRGFSITASRNTIGSFALFGGNQIVRQYALKLDDEAKSGLFHHLISGAGGSIPSLVFSSPFDVIKTRINANGGEQVVDGKPQLLKARQVFKEILVQEGPAAFTKGLGTKLITVAPKLTFSMGVANFLMERSDSILQEVSLFSVRQVDRIRAIATPKQEKGKEDEANVSSRLSKS